MASLKSTLKYKFQLPSKYLLFSCLYFFAVLKSSVFENWYVNNQNHIHAYIYIYMLCLHSSCSLQKSVPSIQGEGKKKENQTTKKTPLFSLNTQKKVKEHFSDCKYTFAQLPVLSYQHLQHVILCIFLSQLIRWLDTLDSRVSLLLCTVSMSA